MTPIQSFLLHLIIAVLLVVAAVVLAVTHVIGGGDALGVIGVAVGVPLGSAVSSSGASQATKAVTAATPTGSIVTVNPAINSLPSIQTPASTSVPAEVLPGASPSTVVN